MNAQRYVKQHTDERSLEDSKLSSGDRLVSASVDPAGFAISEVMKAKIRSNFQAERNSNDSISLLQVAEGSLTVMQNIGMRLKELALQSSSDTYGDLERKLIDREFQELKAEVGRITASTSFNGNNIIRKGSSTFDLQIGVNGTAELDRIIYDMNKVMDTSGNFGMGSIDVRTKEGSHNSLGIIDRMMGQLSSTRAELGSMGARMNSVIQNLQVSRESLSASNSKIRDTDVAKEAANSAITKISQAASLSMLKMSNDNPAAILKLVG